MPADTAERKAPVQNRPFVVGSRFQSGFSYDQSKVLTTGQQKLQTYELDTDGYTAGLYLLVENTSVNNGTVTAAFKEDGPFSALAIVQFSDTNNKPIIGPMTGHDLYEAVKFGGYHFVDDAKQSPVYSVTTGGGTSGGTFSFVLYLPIEIVHRDALGALLNKSASAVFKLDLTLAGTSDIFSAVPVTSSTVRVRIQQFGWADSDHKDIKGNPTDVDPPAINTVQFWDKQSFTVNTGAMNQKLNTFTGGIRNLVFELRDSNGVRSANEGDWPDPFALQVDTYTMENRLRSIWRHLIGEDFGYLNAVETAGGRDYATYPLPFTKDAGAKPGWENRFGYLWASSATSLLMRGTIGGSGAHSLNVFVNYVNPANGDPRSLTGGR